MRRTPSPKLSAVSLGGVPANPSLRAGDRVRPASARRPRAGRPGNPVRPPGQPCGGSPPGSLRLRSCRPHCRHRRPSALPAPPASCGPGAAGRRRGGSAPPAPCAPGGFPSGAPARSRGPARARRLRPPLPSPPLPRRVPGGGVSLGARPLPARPGYMCHGAPCPPARPPTYLPAAPDGLAERRTRAPLKVSLRTSPAASDAGPRDSGHLSVSLFSPRPAGTPQPAAAAAPPPEGPAGRTRAGAGARRPRRASPRRAAPRDRDRDRASGPRSPAAAPGVRDPSSWQQEAQLFKVTVSCPRGEARPGTPLRARGGAASVSPSGPGGSGGGRHLAAVASSKLSGWCRLGASGALVPGPPEFRNSEQGAFVPTPARSVPGLKGAIAGGAGLRGLESAGSTLAVT